MTIYLRMLPLPLERDDTIWRRIDGSWWSFPFAWSFPCLASLTTWAEFFVPRLHPFFLIPLLCHLSTLRSFVTLLDLPPHSLFYAVLLSMMNELCLLCAMLLEIVMSLAHLRFEFISWLTQVELRVSYRS